MLESAVAINAFQMGLFDRIIADIPESTLFAPGAGHGHPPVWILGHLALTGEFGCQLLGGQLAHPEWGPLFGPGSSDVVAPRSDLTRDALAAALRTAYQNLRDRALRATSEQLAAPHGIGLFDGSPIRTMADAITLLLTNHFGAHLSQLSSCRRAAGHRALF